MYGLELNNRSYELLVAERFIQLWRRVLRLFGVIKSDNADMSNVKKRNIELFDRKPKVSWLYISGLVGLLVANDS